MALETTPLGVAPKASIDWSFYGWRIVAAGLVAQFFATMVSLSAFGNFVVPLAAEFETPIGRFNAGISIWIVSMALLGPALGRWVDRGHARRMMVVGVALATLGLLALSIATEIWQLVVAFCFLLGSGTALFGHLPAMALASNWFVRRRGLALGLIVSGATLASAVGPAAAEYMIGEWGWRAALRGFALATFVIALPVFALLVVSRPEEMGLRPDGDAPQLDASGAEIDSLPDEIETSELLRDPRLYLIALGFGMLFTSPIVLVASLVPYAKDIGLVGQQPTAFFVAMAPFSIFGKITFGAMADRIPPKIAIGSVLLGNILVWSILIPQPPYPVYVAAGALYGLAIGAASPLHGVINGLCFGRAAFGRANGIGGLVGLPLLALVPLIGGYLRDETGDYRMTFSLQVGLLILSGVLLAFVRIPKEEPGRASSAEAS